MKSLIFSFLLIALCSAYSYSYDNETDIWYQVEEIVRGSFSGFSNSLGYNKTGECFENVGLLIQLIKDIIAVIKKGKFIPKEVAKLLNDFAQWFSKEWYSCKDMKNSVPYLIAVFKSIGENILKYLGKFGLNLLTQIPNSFVRIYQFIYYHAREEYYKAGIVAGTFTHEVFLKFWIIPGDEQREEII